MSELESLLRAALAEVAPQSPATDGLADRARRYAAHARRVRAAGVAAALTLVLAGGGAVASGALRDLALVPVERVGHLTCALAGQDLPSALLSGSETLSSNAKEVLVCPDGSSDSAWPGSLPDDEPISAAAALDYLRFEPRAGAPLCPSLPAGPVYRMLVLSLDGQVTVHDNQRLACNGWPALDRYFIALGDQKSTESGSTLTDPFLGCPSILQQQLAPASDAPPALHRGTVFAQATACFYPLPDPRRLPRAILPPRRIVLSDLQIAVLNADPGKRGSAKGTPRACGRPQTGVVVVSAVTTTGQSIVLSGICPDTTQAFVNWARDDVVTSSSSTTDMLNGALGIGP
jgi:hypothetical protein